VVIEYQEVNLTNPWETAMNESRTATEEILVHFIRPGVGARDYRLAEGATLADLLRLSGASTTGQAVFIDGVPPEEALRLRDGVVVTITPLPRNASGDEPWRASLPALRDEDVSREYSEVMRSRRESDADGEQRG